MTTETTKQVSVELDNPISINGVKYEVGTHKVSADIAEDLQRMDKAHNKYLAGLNKNVAFSGNGGSISAA